MQSAMHRVDAIAEVFNGKTPSKLQQRDQGHPVLKIRDVDELGRFRGKFSGHVEEDLAAKYVKQQIKGSETLILNAAHSSTHVASKTFYSGEDVSGALATGEWLLIRWKQDVADPRYCHHWLNSPETRFRIRQLVNGIHLYPKDVARLQIPLPPLSEQNRIAGILDAADALRAKRRESIVQLDTLLQSTFLDMFGDPVTNPMGWEEELLGNVANFHAGSTLPAGEDFSGQHSGFLYLKVGDLNHPDNSVVIVRANIWGASSSKGITAPEYSVVIPKRGGAIGTNKKRLLSRPAVLDPNLMAISPGERLAHEYVFSWFHTFDLMSIASGSSVPQLNKRDLAPLSIPVPPLDIQHRYSAIWNSTMAHKSALEAHLVELDTLFASLQSHAFRGDL